MSIHVAVKEAERTIPSWEHLQAQRPNHKSFEVSKSPSINSRWPWVQPWNLSDSLVRVFWLQQRWKKMLLSEQVGAHADHTLLFYFQEAMGQTESIYSNIYSALLESEQRHYQICLIARGFLKWPGPRMGLFPANPLCFPRVWGGCGRWALDELPPVRSHSHSNHDQLLRVGGEAKGLLKAGKQIHS